MSSFGAKLVSKALSIKHKLKITHFYYLIKFKLNYFAEDNPMNLR